MPYFLEINHTFNQTNLIPNLLYIESAALSIVLPEIAKATDLHDGLRIGKKETPNVK